MRRIIWAAYLWMGWPAWPRARRAAARRRGVTAHGRRQGDGRLGSASLFVGPANGRVLRAATGPHAADATPGRRGWAASWH